MACRDSGVKIIRGVDGSWVNTELLLIPAECFTRHDLSQPGLKDKIPEQHFDLTISSEVAEHIDTQDTESYMDNLTSFSDVILFSAAIPGQGGVHHVNEQWPSYWIEKFKARGFIPVDCLRPEIWNDTEIRMFYKQNMMFFVKEERLNDYPALASHAEMKVLDIVHPEVFSLKVKSMNDSIKMSNKGFFTLCKIILSAVFILRPPSFVL